MKLVRLSGVALLLALTVPGIASAQDASWTVNPGLTDTWTFQLGAYIPSVDTTAHLNSASGVIGTDVSLEDDLGFSDRKTLGSFNAAARLGQRWKIEFEYFQLNRSNSRSITKTINWGDQTYPINTTVEGKFDSTVYRLSGGYSFVKNDQAEVGAALGLFVTDFKASLSASGIGGQSADTLAPLPTIALYGAYAFSPRWLLTGRVDYFSLNYNDYDGSLTSVTAGIDYRIARNFGIGAGYRYVDYDLTVSKSDFNGGVRYKFSGPTVYAIASF
jgi:opacity protein-like surface antigen